MTYRNQNYMTNKKIKQEADKNQKNYVSKEVVNEEENVSVQSYGFTSYSDSEGTTEWGTGTVKTTGIESNGYTQVEVVTNSTDQSFIGQKFYITSDAAPNSNTLYQLYADTGTTATGIYVKITQSQE